MKRFKAFMLASVSALALAACVSAPKEATVCVDPGCETTNNIIWVE